MYADTMHYKSEENNLKVAFMEINHNDDFAYSLHIPGKILARKPRITPLRDKTYQKTHQRSLYCHPQLHDDRISRTKIKFVYTLRIV